MLIAVLVAQIVTLALCIVTLIKTFTIDPLRLAKQLMSNEDADTISRSVIDDLIAYCKEKGIEDPFIDTSGDRMKLSYRKGDDVISILEMSFPLTGKGTSEYLSNVEYQKEQIDEFLKGDNNGKTE